MESKPSYEDLMRRVCELEREAGRFKGVQMAGPGGDEHYRALVEEAVDGLFVTDEKGVITFANKALCEMFAHEKPEDMVGRHFLSYVPEKDKERIWRIFEKRIKEGVIKGEIIEVSAAANDGTPLALELKADLVTRDAEVVGTRGIIRDVTEHRLAKLIEINETLRESEAMLNKAEELAAIGSFVLDLRSDTLKWSRNMYAMAGLSADDYPESLRDISEKFVHPEDLPGVLSQLRAMIRSKTTWPMEFRIIRPDGEIRTLKSGSELLFDDKGDVVKCIGIHRDLTIEKRAEDEARKTESFFKEAVKLTRIVAWDWDIPNNRIHFSDEFFELSGMGKNIVTMEEINEIIPLQEREQFRANIREALAGKKPYDMEHRMIHQRTKEIRCVRACGDIIREASGRAVRVLGASQDVTEYKEIELELKSSLREKELLLRELYHRTKNNMQVLISMLNLQRQRVDQDLVKEIFKDMENRIKSMSLVHEKLYKSSSLVFIDMKDYVEDLVQILLASYGDASNRLKVETQMGNVFFSIDTAIPCGLILNELITNSIKHAFPGGRAGRIAVGLEVNESGEVWLGVRDNGVGLPQDFEIKDCDSFGMQSVMALSEIQLGGVLTIKIDEGTSIALNFRIN